MVALIQEDCVKPALSSEKYGNKENGHDSRTYYAIILNFITTTIVIDIDYN